MTPLEQTKIESCLRQIRKQRDYLDAAAGEAFVNSNFDSVSEFVDAVIVLDRVYDQLADIIDLKN